MIKVLVVEDDSFLVDAYSTKLRKAGFKIILATNGEEGLEQAKTSHPDVILLDLLLPKRNGFDVLADLKSDQHLKIIPVIVLSNLGQARDVEQVRQLGAEDYLIKANVTMKDIITKIKHLAKGHHLKSHHLKSHQVGHHHGKKSLKPTALQAVASKSEFKERTTDKMAKNIKKFKPVKMAKLGKVKTQMRPSVKMVKYRPMKTVKLKKFKNKTRPKMETIKTFKPIKKTKLIKKVKLVKKPMKVKMAKPLKKFKKIKKLREE